MAHSNQLILLVCVIFSVSSCIEGSISAYNIVAQEVRQVVEKRFGVALPAIVVSWMNNNEVSKDKTRCAYVYPSTGCIFLNPHVFDSFSDAVKRFIIAHEIGHVLQYRLRTSASGRRYECEADGFAGVALNCSSFPREFYEFLDRTEVQDISKEIGVSMPSTVARGVRNICSWMVRGDNHSHPSARERRDMFMPMCAEVARKYVR